MSTSPDPTTQYELFIDLQLKSWTTHISRVNQLLSQLTDEGLAKEVAPGKNTGVYLLGHLIAVHDGMFRLMELGEALYPQYTKPFLTSPDKSGESFPPVAELRTAWVRVNEKLADGFASLSPSQWLARHTAVSEEDFAREPHRNKLNIVISRTAHLAYHWGQLVLLK